MGYFGKTPFYENCITHPKTHIPLLRSEIFNSKLTTPTNTKNSTIKYFRLPGNVGFYVKAYDIQGVQPLQD